MKDPRFNFYPDNFEGGTDGFTLEQDGAYLRLLILQFRNGTFTEEQALDKLSMRCRGNAVAYTTLWKFLMPKFIPENFDGVNYYNERMAHEIDKSKKTSERQAVTAKSRWEKEKNGNATAYPTASATGDAFNSSSIIVSKESIVGKEKKERTNVKEKSTKVQFNPLDHIPDNWNGDLFLVEWADFMEMRKRKKWSCSEKVLKARINQLSELSGYDWGIASSIMQKSSERGYAEFFAIESKQTSKTTQNGHDPRYSATFVKDKA